MQNLSGGTRFKCYPGPFSSVSYMLLGEDGNFSIGECMRSFEMQMPVQLSTKKPILHISINPHPEDVLTDQQLSDIAKA